MSTTAESPPVTIAELLARLGDVPARRVRLRPYPGTATEQDVIDLRERERLLYELVDGTLVEKGMGYPESLLAMYLGSLITSFVIRHRLGVVAGEAGMMRLWPGRVRIPDLSFASWERLPNRRWPNKPIADFAPDLAVEVLSKSNTRREMAGKLREYFEAGVRLVWYVDPKKQVVTVYTAPDQSTVLRIDDTLDGGDVLPGFALPLRDLFDAISPPQAE
jgi:Uma2 family endonuclease